MSGATRHEPFAGFDSPGHGPGRTPEPPADLRTWTRDLAMGARFAAGGGREGWTRTILTGVGVGLGVALLLIAAAIPGMMHTRDGKSAARALAPTNGELVKPSDRSLLAAEGSTTFRDKDIGGLLLHKEGANAPAPPGVRAVPATGQMVVSPALRKLLRSTPLLRPRFPYKIVGTIGQSGLTGPGELYYYAGSDQLEAPDPGAGGGNADRVTGFGYRMAGASMSPTMLLLLIVMVVVLLLPVAVFVGVAVRMGGERRDRRLAALRLVGADIRMTRRIAAGEALLGALLGLLCGWGFFLLGRQLVGRVTIRGITAFPSDLRPGPGLTGMIMLAVPVAAVAVTMLSLRGTSIEPLGVVRQGAGRRRRLWWRLLIPVVGFLLLLPMFHSVRSDSSGLNESQVVAGTVLLLFGVTAILPWLVELVVGRLRGGPVAWQLATRRLQLSSGASARMVSGVTVAVAGAIALQMLFGGVNGQFQYTTGADTGRAQAFVSARPSGPPLADVLAAVRGTRGVKEATGYVSADATQPDASTVARRGGDSSAYAYLPLMVGDCRSLAQLASVTGCRPGSSYIVRSAQEGNNTDLDRYARPGAPIDLNDPDSDTYTGTPRLWRIPADARTAGTVTDVLGIKEWGLLLTPEALGDARLTAPKAQVAVGLDPEQPDAMEYLRNTGVGFGVGTAVMTLRATAQTTQYTQLRRGLFVGAALTLGLIGAGLLVTMLEQLRDRRKLLAVLVAFGTRRSALAWSVLWQTAVPVLLGLLLACAGGLGLGAALLAMVNEPFHADWGSMATMSAIGGGVVLAVTLLSLPVLWRLMRPDGLRTE
ncbi:FtsX-like permease family protein [Streptomyces sp. CA-111067]|uniref:FtsX-like permease family protein n=1 Tax=Streptomyces sp. CA-111067 TaxID=3240046 RepID=UPI003D97834E